MPRRGTSTKSSRTPESHWSSRPVLAWSIRALITLAPTVLSFLTTFFLARKLPPHALGLNVFVWWVGLFAVGLIVLLASDSLARRMLPLVALFKLSLIFPDQAPNRFSTALRTGTTRQLQRRVHEAQAAGRVDRNANYATTMLEMVAALSVHDRLTRGHCERVRAYTDLIVEEMGLDDRAASKLRWSSLLHDVGKLMVPQEILTKTGRPTDAEWTILKTHPMEGDRLISPLKPWLGEWHNAVSQHHERWDGDGYPFGLSGNDIHLGARIVSVADAFDVMTSVRSYKKPMPASPSPSHRWRPILTATPSPSVLLACRPA